MTNKNNSSKKPQDQSKQHRIPLFRRSWFIAIIILVVIIATIGLIICFNCRHADDRTNDEATNIKQTDQTHNTEDQSTTSVSSSNEEDRPEDKVIQFEGENPNNLEELTGVVTYRGVESGQLIIDTSIDQYLTNGGTCTATIKGKNTGHTETATKPAHADIATSYCETFEISVAGLPSDYYEIEIIISSNDKKGTIKDGVQL